MASCRLAVDVDNTLVTWGENSTPQVNEDVRDLLRAWKRLGGMVIVWSGGGADYADGVVRRLGLTHLVDVCAQKGAIQADICIDDQETKLCSVNFKLPGDIDPQPWMALGLDSHAGH